MQPEICGILHSGYDPLLNDPHGCVLPVGHPGPHLFVAQDGRHIHWETDLECDCEHCSQALGDYCTTYWEVPAQSAFRPASPRHKKPR